MSSTPPLPKATQFTVREMPLITMSAEEKARVRKIMTDHAPPRFEERQRLAMQTVEHYHLLPPLPWLQVDDTSDLLFLTLLPRNQGYLEITLSPHDSQGFLTWQRLSQQGQIIEKGSESLPIPRGMMIGCGVKH